MRFFIFILILIPISLFSQKDTLVNNSLYESLYSYTNKSPIWVRYTLYKGGGDCNRSQFNFKSMRGSASNKDYVASGFDKGHLVPAEDFSYNCDLVEKTFYFYNVVAQYPNMNRGTWKSYESKVRNLSQTDSLSITCGCVYGADKIPTTSVSIPSRCWKVVKSLKTNEILICVIFTNNKEKNSVKKVKLDQILKLDRRIIIR